MSVRKVLITGGDDGRLARELDVMEVKRLLVSATYALENADSATAERDATAALEQLASFNRGVPLSVCLLGKNR